MASSKHPFPTLNRDERRFWRQAFLAAELPYVLRQGSKVSPQGIAHFSAEYADSAINEFRRRFRA
jgi:hypothetical protein